MQDDFPFSQIFFAYGCASTFKTNNTSTSQRTEATHKTLCPVMFQEIHEHYIQGNEHHFRSENDR